MVKEQMAPQPFFRHHWVQKRKDFYWNEKEVNERLSKKSFPHI